MPSDRLLMRRAFACLLAAGVALCGLTSPARAVCVGDCSETGQVLVIDLIHGILIAQGEESLVLCPSFDVNGDGAVSIDELLTGVDNLLNGCVAQ